MRLQERIWIVASGDSGFSLSHPTDCTVYLVDGGSESALIDAGCGLGAEEIEENIKKTGHSLSDITKIFLTHGHGDHAGGAWRLAKDCGAEVYALEETASYVSRGDRKALSIDAAVEAGVYEKDFSFHACPVIPLEDGQITRVGDLEIEAVQSEGHCAGHSCYMTVIDKKKVLFCGDPVYYGGKISLQSIWDCDLAAYIKTCLRLAEIRPEVFLPAHGAIALGRGYLHTEKAAQVIRELGIPKNAIGE